MDLKDFETIFAFWKRDVNMTIKTTWAKERFIKHINTVGSGDNNYARFIIKTIHLDENLVKCLFILTTCTTSGITLMCDSVNLIDKDDAWGILFCLTKEVTDTRSTNTHKHFSKFGTGNTKEWNISFASNCTSHQSFTSTWITGEKYATWDFCAKFFIFFRIFQKVDNFSEVLLCSFIASNIGEENAFFVWAI